MYHIYELKYPNYDVTKNK